MRLKLHHWILIGMLLGAGVGLPLNILAEKGRINPDVVRSLAYYGKQVGDLFLRLLMMMVVPLIVTSMISGVASTGSLRGLGRIGTVTIGYFMLSTALAVILGIALVNTVQPGLGADLALLESEAQNVPAAVTQTAESNPATVIWRLVVDLVPPNPLANMADPTNRSILGVIFFSLVFGAFITVVGGEAGDLLTRLSSAAFQVFMRMTMAIIWTAPVGVMGFMLYAAAGKGLSVFVSLGWYMLTVALGLVIQTCVVLPILLRLLGRRSPREYFKAMAPALVTAFSTSSSNATLPVTIACVEKRAGISNRISSFVLPLGATINMNGTALYEAVAALFVAQAYGVHLTFVQQGIVALTSLLAAVGSAGIPSAGIVMMAVVFSAVGLPLEPIGLILAVDRVLDMGRTVVNVWGDMTAAAVVERFESNG